MEVVAVMLGMDMAPAKARLVPCSHGYCGPLRLPMFGRYQAQAALSTPAGRSAGTLSIDISLPLG
jgi:hypothetical protein